MRSQDGSELHSKQAISTYTKKLYPEPLFHVISPNTADFNAKNEFYEGMKPLLITLKMFGVFPYRLSSNGHLDFKFLSTITLYSAVLVTVLSVGAVQIFSERIEKLFSSDITFERAIIECNMAGGYITMAIISILYLLEIKKRIRFIIGWKTYQGDFKRITHQDLSLNLKLKAWCILAITVILTALGTLNLAMITNLLQWWQLVITTLGSLLLVILPLLWAITCYALKKAAFRLADEIVKYFASHSPKRKDTVFQFKYLWLQLSHLTQDVGNSSGCTFFTYILFCFVSQVLSAYGSLAILGNGYSNLLVGEFMAAIGFTLTIYLQCHSAHCATEEVGLKFQNTIQQIMKEHPLLGTDVNTEMNDFLGTISRNPPVISYCGFVNVNKGLHCSFMSQMVTYLIVLMQFQISSVESTTQNSPTTDSSIRKETNQDG